MLENVCLFQAKTVFEKYEERGIVDKKGFHDNMKKLITNANSSLTANQKIQIDQTVSKLYSAFDLDGNGILDYQEMSAALVILC